MYIMIIVVLSLLLLWLCHYILSLFTENIYYIHIFLYIIMVNTSADKTHLSVKQHCVHMQLNHFARLQTQELVMEMKDPHLLLLGPRQSAKSWVLWFAVGWQCRFVGNIYLYLGT